MFLLLLLALTASAETIDLIRDPYGVPHIFAKTRPGAAFGAGFAQAEDRPDALIRNLASATEPGELSPSVLPIVEAYASGVNRSLEAQGRSERIRPEQVAAYARRAYNWIKGSNDLLLGPGRTASRSVIAVLAPVADWSAVDRPYEIELYASEDNFSIGGVAPAGMPFPIVGYSQFVAVGWSGSAETGGPRTLEEAWALITARNLDEVNRALEMKQIPGDALAGTSAGEILDTGGRQPNLGYLRREGLSKNGDAAAIEQLRVQRTWSAGRVENLALSTDVYKAEEWQRYLARVVPENKLARRLTGWNRRADADSRDALAFYIFKLALERDSSAVEPPDSISPTRLRAALSRALDILETKLEYNATFGTLFRSTREGARESYPIGGGNLPEAGIDTPRTLFFTRPNVADPNALHLVTSGQSATIVVELSKEPAATSLLLPGESDDPASPYFDDQSRRTTLKRTFFRDRKSLERVSSSRKQLIF